ncbi:NERD domain-containing protein/DEAD/DEAH box helicase [Dysgonomonas mossii]|uniref:DNA 3'-5' helicase II n=2 Tax=Dysgonomonas mossii TaxID=163665 RepID=A0A4Y9IP87_9BACT|nr:NERD domain-containing protein/DEAD/DEAH box helicase [Dysgonomonas mossii]TFU90171.1 nuclease [Dysgonomonas mossii]
MAILYPQYDIIMTLKVPPTEGEKRIIDFLLDILNDEYEIFFQPFLNGDCPDIIVMRKGGGILIIEVKDWDLNSYHIKYKDKWHVSYNNAYIKSPISQVLKYKENLYDLHIQSLLDLKLKDYKYWLIVNCAVFFYNENHNDIYNFIFAPFHERQRGLNINDTECQIELQKYKDFIDKNVSIIGKDDLKDSFFNSLLNKTWISRKSRYFDLELYRSFKRYLKPSFHSIEDGKDIRYTTKQKELIISKDGEQKIRGIAGSGKTLVLAKRAINAHIRKNETILILTYNISLRNYIHEKLSDVRENFHWESFHILNYHDFINSIMNNLGIEFMIPKDFDCMSSIFKEQFFNQNYYGNIKLFEKHIERINKYSTILIDEVQDFQTEWLRIVKKYFLAQDGEFVVFGDSKQDIYNRVSLDSSNKKSIQIPDSPGRWNELNQSFRLTPILTAYASNFQNTFMKEKHDVDIFDNTENIQRRINDNIYYKYLEGRYFDDIIKTIIQFSKTNRIHPNDICILSSSIDLIRELDFLFRDNTKEKTYIMSETKEQYDERIKKSNNNKKYFERIRKNKKIHFWMNSGLTKLSTVHSFKGWEIDSLFFIITEDFETNYELTYTGFTRCINNLIILNIGNIRFDLYMKSLPYVIVL